MRLIGARLPGYPPQNKCYDDKGNCDTYKDGGVTLLQRFDKIIAGVK